jgi:hypothetical protein
VTTDRDPIRQAVKPGAMLDARAVLSALTILAGLWPDAAGAASPESGAPAAAVGAAGSAAATTAAATRLAAGSREAGWPPAIWLLGAGLAGVVYVTARRAGRDA